MRHETLLDKSGFRQVSLDAVLPAGVQLAPVPAAELEECARGASFVPTPAANDVPAAVGGLLFASYLALIGAFALATVGSAESIFVVTISALFVITFFTVPRLFFGVEPKAGRRPTLERFLRDGLQTLTGHSSGKDALVQMLIVPVLLTCAALAMGVAAALIM